MEVTGAAGFLGGKDMSKENMNFRETAGALFEGMNVYLSSKTVVGQPIQVKDAILVPLSDVSFGMGAGAYAKTDKNNSAGGVTGKMSPNAILVIQNGTTRLISVKSTDNVGKALDMVPDIIARFTGKAPAEDADIAEAVDNIKNGEA